MSNKLMQNPWFCINLLGVNMTDCADDANLNTIDAFLAGLFSLLGAFAGAFIARRTDHIKWLRENRSETFAHFLVKLNEAQETGHNILLDRNLDVQKRNILFTEAYIPLENYARIVRFYLPKCVRDEFSQLVREIRTLHGSPDCGDSRLTVVGNKMDRIQAIFESALSA